MIQSMTGYGKTVVAFEGKKINVEIKSLNSKQLDLSTRIAPLYREKEMEIRQLIAERVIRGKVEFNIWIEKDAVAEAAQVNKALMENYYQQLTGFAGVAGRKGWCTGGCAAPGGLSYAGRRRPGEEVC